MPLYYIWNTVNKFGLNPKKLIPKCISCSCRWLNTNKLTSTEEKILLKKKNITEALRWPECCQLSPPCCPTHFKTLPCISTWKTAVTINIKNCFQAYSLSPTIYYYHVCHLKVAKQMFLEEPPYYPSNSGSRVFPSSIWLWHACSRNVLKCSRTFENISRTCWFYKSTK